MRKIMIQFEVPEDIEADYSDVDPQLVFKDLFPSDIGFRVISDTESKQTICNISVVCPSCGEMFDTELPREA